MTQQLGQVAVGTLVKLNENGSPVEFYVAKHDYESGLNGTGRTLLVRKECYDNRVWNNVQVNTYASSALDSWLNSDYKNLLDSNFLTVIGTTKFQYTIGYGDKTLSTLERAIFQLSRTELGFTLPADANFEGNILPIASILQKAFLNGETNSQWTRTPNTSYLTAAFFVYAGGNSDSTGVTGEAGSRPAFTVPSTLSVTDDGTLSLASAPPHAITVPAQAMQGKQLAVSWSAVDGADGYILERKANTDADWVQVYSGADLTFSETAGTWESVQYRVKSGANGKYGEYTISSLVDVVPVSILVISGSDGNLGTLTNDVQYSVSSSGTSALTVTESAGRTTRTFTATNGATIRIPVIDLPTGTGTIKITASTNPGSGVVTVTRNWTYSKTAPTFANAGSTAQLQQDGKNIFPLTLLECVRGAENLAPAMKIGIEYRTSELYNGKPVFVMAVDGGAFPDSSSKTIDVQTPDTSGQVKMLDCYGVLDNGTQIPGLFGESVFDASNYLGLFTQNGNGKFTISVGAGRTVGLNFTLFLKYWKEGT